MDAQLILARCIGHIEFRKVGNGAIYEAGQGTAAKQLIELLAAEGMTIVPIGSQDHLASMPYRKDDPRTY